jgi:hypothetical protein
MLLQTKTKPMPKQTKAVTAMGELNDVDKRLASKLIITLKGEQLDEQSRQQINRVINKARRGPNSASPEVKRKYANGYTTFYKQRFPTLKKTRKQLDVTEAGRLIGAEWQALGAAEKQAYKEEAAQDKG